MALDQSNACVCGQSTKQKRGSGTKRLRGKAAKLCNDVLEFLKNVACKCHEATLLEPLVVDSFRNKQPLPEKLFVVFKELNAHLDIALSTLFDKCGEYNERFKAAGSKGNPRNLRLT